MKTASKDYIINTVFKTNILPLISECNTSCVFCSHRQNPSEVEVFRMPKLSVDDFGELTDFLHADRKIIIGESATRIVEGEPLLYRGCLDVVTMLREKYRGTPIQITTNGILLDNHVVSKLVELDNIELNISVNCVNPSKRCKILKSDTNIRKVIEMLNGRIKMSGSCVFLPDMMTSEDLEQIVELLDSNGADTVRIFLPGYTYLSGKEYELRQIYDQVNCIADSLRSKYRIPIVVEPTFISDLAARVEGVIPRAFASVAGIRHGDIITEVDGVKVLTRVDAFSKAFRKANPTITILRGGEQKNIKLEKRANSAPGFVVLFDADTDVINQINMTAKRYGAEKVLIVTSRLAEGILSNLQKNPELVCVTDVLTAENLYFGGTIQCAGLLTLSDVVEAASKYIMNNPKPDLILLPPIMFDHRRRDLLGCSIGDIKDVLGVPVDTV